MGMVWTTLMASFMLQACMLIDQKLNYDCRAERIQAGLGLDFAHHSLQGALH